MAFADLGQIGTAGTTTANQNDLVCTATTAGAAVGNLVVVAVAVDNRVTGGGDDLSVSGVTDSVGNVYLKARQNATNLAAQTGTSVSIWWSQIKTAIPITTGTITAAFTTNTTSDAQCMVVRKYSLGVGNFVQVFGTNAGTSTTTNPGSLNVTTLNKEHLRIRAIGCEFDSTQTLTVTAGGWAAWTEAASAASGTIAEQCVEVEWLINTSTGTASAPTLGSACDNASVYVAFQEVTPAPEVIDPPKKTVSTTSQKLALIAALSAVAEPVYIPPVALAIDSVQASVHSEATVVPSWVIYDQTSTPVSQPVAPATISSTLSSAYGTTTVVTSRVVYDQTSTPVFVPPTVVAAVPYGALGTSCTVVRTSIIVGDQTSTPVFPPTPPTPSVEGQFVSDDAPNWTRRDKIKPTPLSAVVLAYPIELPCGALGTSCTVVRTSVIIGDQTSTPVFPPEPPEPPEPVAGQFVSDGSQNWVRRDKIKPVPLSSFVFAYPIEESYGALGTSCTVVRTSIVVGDQTSTPVFPPEPPEPPEPVAGQFVPDDVLNWKRLDKIKPVPLSSFVFAYPIHDLAEDYTGQFIRSKRNKILPDGIAIPPFIEPPAPPTIDTKLVGVYGAVAVITSHVVYDQTSAPVFRSLAVTPSEFGYQTVDAVWKKFCKVRADDGFVRPLILPPPSPVVPPGAVTGGGGLGFSYQRYERLVNELYQKKKKAPPKAKKALAKALEIVEKVDTRAEDLARLLQALEAAAATSTQNTLATINAANAAADQARLVLEQQRLRQLREEDDLILMMLEEED